ncbi:hypothetical protein [Pseudomonas mangiferae]|uniref:Glyoxalase-like domain-containing protein n=1 Tax=Pseudomonas mangiferae TaxID=2593654 RepID=A0A553H134_9PSED|nr:hypothetical protein [Pseudomonas mangiferae]TRX75450.1 hypothetical protein FM069_06845 [Pseudomonas mangiferae]
MRQPDIEIYVKDADLPAVSAWLEGALGPCSTWRQQGQVYKATAEGEGAAFRLAWLPKAVGKWHSLFIDSPATPWEDDRACARAAFAALGVEIRCATGGWDEEEDEEAADRWVKVDAEGEREFVWRTD